ncbi:MAG: 50S ribosomal protein L6 [Candidatus Chisholmbacteria bacterium]|nr:50S ribosomal protein L6 [Candidatus Chisholmbacteria bacterium]
MSRIGNQPINIPSADVKVDVNERMVVVRGPGGELTYALPPQVRVKVEAGLVKVEALEDSREARAKHGLVRAVLSNLIQGVTSGYEKRLELVGAGYRAAVVADKLQLNVGFSHPVVIEPQGISFTVEGTNLVVIRGADKQLVGQMAAKIRHIRPPEPYKGKGIRYQGETVRHKAGKTAKVGVTPGGGQG